MTGCGLKLDSTTTMHICIQLLPLAGPQELKGWVENNWCCLTQECNGGIFDAYMVITEHINSGGFIFLGKLLLE